MPRANLFLLGTIKRFSMSKKNRWSRKNNKIHTTRHRKGEEMLIYVSRHALKHQEVWHEHPKTERVMHCLITSRRGTSGWFEACEEFFHEICLLGEKNDAKNLFSACLTTQFVDFNLVFKVMWGKIFKCGSFGWFFGSIRSSVTNFEFWLKIFDVKFTNFEVTLINFEVRLTNFEVKLKSFGV